MDWQEPVPLKKLLLFPHGVPRMVHYLRTSSDINGPSKLACVHCSRMARMSHPLRASNEGSPRPRIARA